MPTVSIVMPVYNAAPYLEEALRSMLKQRFTDLECIVINDGSTDDSEAVVRSFRDPRLHYLANDGNRGLVYTLNRGIDEAHGKYIARMDGDDISLPDRLEEQVSYMNSHPEVDVLATVVKLIDPHGNPTGYWKEDRENVTADAIRAMLPVNNCIAHPSVLMKAEVLRAFRYLHSQAQAEDYDLWLRLLSAGKTIHKLEKPLLLHRILPGSFTRKRQKNVFFKLAETKLRFALGELRSGKRNAVVVRAGLSSFSDYGKGYLKEMKNWIAPE